MRLVGTCWNPSACIGPQKHWDFRPQKKIRLKAHWLNFGEVCIQLLHWFVVSCIVPSSQTVPYNPFPTSLSIGTGCWQPKFGWWVGDFNFLMMMYWAVEQFSSLLPHGCYCMAQRCWSPEAPRYYGEPYINNCQLFGCISELDGRNYRKLPYDTRNFSPWFPVNRFSLKLIHRRFSHCWVSPRRMPLGHRYGSKCALTRRDCN